MYSKSVFIVHEAVLSANMKSTVHRSLHTLWLRAHELRALYLVRQNARSSTPLVLT